LTKKSNRLVIDKTRVYRLSLDHWTLAFDSPVIDISGVGVISKAATVRTAIWYLGIYIVAQFLSDRHHCVTVT